MKWHSKVLGVSFWMVILGCFALIILAFLHILSRHSATTTRNEPSAPQLKWLMTLDGERRGFAIASDLRRDGAAWELWGPGPGLAPLNTIANLRPGTFFTNSGFGMNGGYWDEARQPVGVCAGERGIHGARSHPGGFALAGDRAWIGPLTAHVRLVALAPASVATSRTLELALNPRPLPRRAPSLIDPAAEAGPVKPEWPVQVVWLERIAPGPLRFNTRETLQVRKTFRAPAGQPLPEAPAQTLMLIRPEKEKGPAEPLPALGDRYRLVLTLEQLKGEVRLATCAGPRLIKEGKISVSLTQTENARAERTWRTAVGCDADGHRLWVLMLARGRDGLPGATLRETAQTLLELGATEALNLDGGSSTSAWYSQLQSELRPLFPLQSGLHHAIFLRKDLAVTTLQP